MLHQLLINAIYRQQTTQISRNPCEHQSLVILLFFSFHTSIFCSLFLFVFYYFSILHLILYIILVLIQVYDTVSEDALLITCGISSIRQVLHPQALRLSIKLPSLFYKFVNIVRGDTWPTTFDCPLDELMFICKRIHNFSTGSTIHLLKYCMIP